MANKHPLVERHSTGLENCDGESDRLSEASPRNGTPSEDLSCVDKLLLADWRGRWGKPLTADELLTIASGAFEALFHGPPIGPIPDYLIPHLSVYGCVAEYEEKLDELDRWKALQLSRWLKDRVGTKYRLAGKVYQLLMEGQEAGGAERFLFRLTDDPSD